MKKNGSAVKKGINLFVLILIISSIFTACEQDFSEVGSDLVDNSNFNSLIMGFNNGSSFIKSSITIICDLCF